jgi:hypothetical protein
MQTTAKSSDQWCVHRNPWDIHGLNNFQSIQHQYEHDATLPVSGES